MLVGRYENEDLREGAGHHILAYHSAQTLSGLAACMSFWIPQWLPLMTISVASLSLLPTPITLHFHLADTFIPLFLLTT